MSAGASGVSEIFDAIGSRPVTVLLLGPPGAGKGTQADVLRRGFGFHVVASGVLLRRHVAEGTEVGTLAAGYMRRGDLVPEAVVADVVLGELARHNGGPGGVEGCPEPRDQAARRGGCPA